MRYTEFLLEYDRSREQARIEAVGAYQARQLQDPDFSLEQLESADPTAQKIYVPRLATWWLRGIKLEDLISRGADLLEKFVQLKQKNLLKPEHKDINAFKQFSDFADALNTYVLPGDAAPENRGKYTQIHRDSQLIVVQLLDKAAAVWWGRGAQWCTKAQKNNRFEYYASQGPVYVILDRVNNTRYQLWWNQTDTGEFQFMDVQDKRFNPTQLPFYHQLRLIFAPLHPHLMWKTNPTPAEQLAAVEQDGDAIGWIQDPSLQVQLAAVQKNSRSIRYIQNPSAQVQLAAVEQDVWAIHYITNPTPEAQLAAVEQNGYAIEHIKNPTPEAQLAAVGQNGRAIEYISNPTPEAQLAAVGQNGRFLRWILNPTPQAQLAAAEQLAGRGNQKLEAKSNQVVTELFEPKPISDLDPGLNIQALTASSGLWSWQFQVADASGKPKPYCLRATNLRYGYYMPDELAKCWMVMFMQASCDKPLTLDPETLATMGDLGDMGTQQAISVFSTCGSLINDFASKTNPQGLVFNGVPGREKLYSLFANVIKKITGWQHVTRSGSFMMDQNWYFFAANTKTMKNMLKVFEDLGQID